MLRMLESPRIPAAQRPNRAIVGVKLGQWLLEKRREAEAVPVLERGIQACRGFALNVGLNEIQWDAEMALLEALYALKQRDQLLATLKTVVRAMRSVWPRGLARSAIWPRSSRRCQTVLTSR
jgi:hypothetical protein